MTITQKMQQIENAVSYEVMNVIDFIQFLLGLRNGSFTFSRVFTLVEADMNKRGNPYWGRVQKMSIYNCGLQGGYEQMVNNKREKLGLNEVEDVEKFIALPSWYQPLNGKPSCAVGNGVSKPDQYYVSVYPNGSYTTEVVYFIDGVEATDFELEQLKTFLKKSSKGSNRQGLPEDEQIVIRRPFIESVKYFHADGRKIKVVA